MCAFPDCSHELLANIDGVVAVIGEEAHIRSGQANGPRYDPGYSRAQIDTYDNLILLCPSHHRLVDKEDGRGFSIQELEEMRSRHEAAMSASRSAGDEACQRRLERLAATVEVWEDTMLLDDWENLTSSLNSPTPILEERLRSAMLETSKWLLGRDLPAEFPAIREAFGRFGEVLSAINAHISDRFEWTARGILQLEREYKEAFWPPETYFSLATKFQMDCEITWCLTIELSKAANLVIRAVREEIEPSYRFDKGVLLAQDGENVLHQRPFRHEYENHTWGEEFPSIDLKQWRALIQDEAERRQLDRPDHINPFEMVLLIDDRLSSDDGTE